MVTVRSKWKKISFNKTQFSARIFLLKMMQTTGSLLNIEYVVSFFYILASSSSTEIVFCFPVEIIGYSLYLSQRFKQDIGTYVLKLPASRITSKMK